MSRSKFASALVAAAFAMGVAGAARADDAKCQDAVAKGSRNVGNQEQKKNRKCVKDGTGDIDTCVDTESPKAAVKETKLVDLFAVGGKCDPVPPIGVNSSASDIATETETSSGDILRKTFGDPVDGIVAGSKCQDKIAKRAGKKFDTELKAFRSCIKDAAPLASQGALDTCIANGVNDAKAQTTVQPKLLNDMTSQCDFTGGLAPLGMDDGDCSTCVDAATCATCIGDIVDCEACEAMVNSSNGSADCDLLDDGMANASCSSPAPPPVCPLTSGIYTTTQLTGGTLDVYSFAPFPFPSGGTIVQHVGPGNVSCVHNTVVPFPGGFTSPNFCVPALMFTTSVTQTGCGVGRIDSNGGSDFTMNEVADTSDAGCGFTSACTNGANKAIRADVTVGNAAADTCGSGGTANALVTVPVHTKSWSDTSGGTYLGCPGDGVFNGTDMVAAEFDQILDFTTDTATGKWMDLDSDGCTIAGFGPAAGYTKSGVCIDTGTNTITAVAVGEFGATGGLFDGTFATVLPSSFTGPSGAASATCGSPPLINLGGGTVTRCIP
jgi:hypothetical protein